MCGKKRIYLAIRFFTEPFKFTHYYYYYYYYSI